MKKILTLILTAGMLTASLISCGLPDGATSDAQSALPVVQATASLADKVSIELTSQFDTAVQYNTVGQVIRIKFSIRMAKNDLTDATAPNITFLGATPVCPAVNTIGNLNDRFDAGEVMECPLDYSLTQADLDRGSVALAVTVNIYTVNSNTANVNVPTVPSKALTTTISANPTTYSQTGQVVTFTYTLKNSGSTQIGPSQCTVTHNLISAAAFNCGNADAVIAPGATLTCTANYTLTAADLGNASISASATGTCPGVNPAQSAPISLTKATATASASGTVTQHTVREGEWLWQIARCYGADPVKTVAANSQLANAAQLKAGMTVNVPNAGSVGTAHRPPEPCVTIHTVKSGDTWSSIATQYGNVDPGFMQFVNSSTLNVGGLIKVPHYTIGMNFPVNNPSTPVTTTALSISVTPNPLTYSQTGQIITFTYVIKNSGNTTIGPAQCTVTDPLLSQTPINCGPSNSTLAPNATVTCSANYTITQPNMDSASISNNAKASCGNVGPSAADVKTITKSVALLTLDVVPTPTTYSQAGQVITFTYIVKNSGTTALGPTQFTVTDGLISSAAFNCGPANTTLAPNATVTCTSSYTITQDNMNNASITNNATASGGALTSQPVQKTILRQ